MWVLRTETSSSVRKISTLVIEPSSKPWIPDWITLLIKNNELLEKELHNGKEFGGLWASTVGTQIIAENLVSNACG